MKLQTFAGPPPSQNLAKESIFLGMANQLGKFSEHLADKTKSIREQRIWRSVQQSTFKQTKADLTQAPVLAL